jgi:predicted nucleotide-binding protein (sugar kinase/HSP70/actin superfamily)
MKTIKYIALLLLAFTSYHSTSQVFIGELEEVHVGYEQFVKNDFDSINNNINNNKNFKFKKALKDARRSQDTLELVGNKTTLQISQEEYLKTIRKAANRSNDSTEFISKIVSEFPELKKTIIANQSFDQLYDIVRPNTFNGRLDALPDVL